MVFKQIEAEVWTAKTVNEAIEGVYMSKEANAGKYDSTIYKIIAAGGKCIAVFGNQVLDGKMDYVSFSDKIRIVYKGLVKSKNDQEYKDYDVLVDDNTA